MKKFAAILVSIFILCALLPVSAAAAEPIQPEADGVKLHFFAWGDPQVSHYLTKREPFLIASSKDVKENQAAPIDALVIAGDITENSIDREWSWVYNDIKDIGVKNYIAATGNHDIRLHRYSDVINSFTSFTNGLNEGVGSPLRISRLHYSYTINGYTFIVLGSDLSTLEEAELLSPQLNWLKIELKKAYKAHHPTFVVIHQPLKDTHGLPDTWGSPIKSAGSVGPQSDKLKKILNTYPNTVLITGHLHTGFGKYNYERIGNIYSVNLPSLCVDCENGEYNDNGIGYTVEAYNNRVVFRARDFDNGAYLPKYNITINLYVRKVKLEKKTYVYDGRVKTPKVTVYNSSGKKVDKKYYTVKYQKGRKNPGKYKVKIVFKGKYKKALPITKTFKIVKKG